MKKETRHIGPRRGERHVGMGLARERLEERKDRNRLFKTGKGAARKVPDAPGRPASVGVRGTQTIDKNVIAYTVAAINDFAKMHRIPVREANNYLIRFRGIDFLKEHYDAEHLLSSNDSVEDLTQVCLNNGGDIR